MQKGWDSIYRFNPVRARCGRDRMVVDLNVNVYDVRQMDNRLQVMVKSHIAFA